MALRPATPQEVPVRRSRGWWLALCGAVLVVLTGTAATGVRYAPAPRDTVTLETWEVPAPGALDRAAALLRTRLTAAGHPATVTVTGPRTVAVRGADPDAVRQLAAPGRVSLRAVLGGPVVPDPRPAGTGTRAPAGDLATLEERLGPAYALAARLTDPSQVDGVRAAVLAPFGRLTPDEVALLPPLMQFAVPAIGCDQVGGPDTGQLTACQAGIGKYLLDVAGVGPADIAGATVTLDAHLGWAARLRFTAAGQARWAALVAAVRADPVSRQLAVVVDGWVIAAPGIDDPGTADALVSAHGLRQPDAARLAALLGCGPLPVVFTPIGQQTVRQ
jgi:preprotein translocase subunit SecD